MRDPKTSVSIAMALLLLAGPLLQPLPTANAGEHASVGSALRQALEDRPDEVVLGLLTLVDGEQAAEVARDLPGEVDAVRVYEDFGVIAVRGTNADVAELGDEDAVESVTANQAIERTTKTEAIASRARAAWANLSTHEPARVGGERVTGDGVGVAVIDSGVDAAHPDLRENVEVNQEFICSTPGLVGLDGSFRCLGWWALDEVAGAPTDLDGCTDRLWVEAANTDDGGHGTHIAGTVAGDGTASDGRWAGVAPDASLYGLGIGNSEAMFSFLEALQWIDCNHDRVSPSIEVVSMSLATPYRAPAIEEAIAHLAEEEHINVVLSAGNGGCCDTMNPLAHVSAPGVLDVAAYDDEDRATRSGDIHPRSSRCATDSPAHACPDLAAPGTWVMAPRSSTSFSYPAFGGSSPYYEMRSGTSMATPHVSGIIALLLEANPALSPAEIEDVLEDTAQPVGDEPTVEDPSNEGNVSIAAGHGLVDAVAALGDDRVLGDAADDVDRLPQLASSASVKQAGFVDPALTPGAPPIADTRWTVASGTEQKLLEWEIESGNGTAWPLSKGQACRFLVYHEGTDPVVLPCEHDLRNAFGGGFRMSASYDFPDPGTYEVEAQIDFPGHSYESFDRLTVTAR